MFKLDVGFTLLYLELCFNIYYVHSKDHTASRASRALDWHYVHSKDQASRASRALDWHYVHSKDHTASRASRALDWHYVHLAAEY